MNGDKSWIVKRMGCQPSSSLSGIVSADPGAVVVFVEEQNDRDAGGVDSRKASDRLYGMVDTSLVMWLSSPNLDIFNVLHRLV